MDLSKMTRTRLEQVALGALGGLAAVKDAIEQETLQTELIQRQASLIDILTRELGKLSQQTARLAVGKDEQELFRSALLQIATLEPPERIREIIEATLCLGEPAEDEHEDEDEDDALADCRRL